jgi:hypothetical protein
MARSGVLRTRLLTAINVVTLAGVIAVMAAPRPAEAVMYGANCSTGLSQWSQEPDAEGRHQRLVKPVPLDGATLMWCRGETGVMIEVLPVQLGDGRPWYRLRAVLPGPISTGDGALLDEVELGQ